MTIPPGVKAVGFDMDMTLLDSVVDFERMTHVVEDEMVSLGVPSEVIAKDKVVRSTDNSIGWLIANGKKDALVHMEENIERRATAIEMEKVEQVKPHKGAKELLFELKAAGYPVGLLTRGSRTYVERALAVAGLEGMFDAIITRTDYSQADSKPSPKAMEHLGEKLGVKPSSILYIGDEPVDFKTAQAVGAPFIGVECGALSRQAWRDMFGDSVETYPTVDEIRLLFK